jgi:TetR/AcrR family transcriptional regulator of autoinduction and epiphytic fitness
MRYYNRVESSVNPELGRRERKAQQTRRHVLAAAEKLFVRDGYGATTIAAVADEADVAVQTVYAVFRNKRTLLTDLLAARVAGDEGGGALRDRAEWRKMEKVSDPRRQLALLSAIATRIGKRIGTLYDVLAAAAGTDQDIAELFRRQQKSRYNDQHRVAQLLHDHGALTPDLTADRATDILWAVANPLMYRNLVQERGWSDDDYERWLTDTLTHALLPSSRRGTASAT